ncbi:MAG: hypothetical protein JSV95_13495 [Gemmatimonadota bacterium]|jgi:hypothetical protein|nr:MAG: hypothetical protein JSV95_13495 [Gemmatimonadota bacterium]
MSWKRSAAVLALLLASAHPAMAQRRADTHTGFWFSAGGGAGWLEGSSGGAFYVRMGGTPTRKALFGGEVITWFRDGGSSTNIAATALLYPFYETTGAPGHDLFFRGSFGLAATDGGSTGLGLMGGTGYDLRLADNLYVTPSFDVMVQVFDQATLTTLFVTLGLGFH